MKFQFHYIFVESNKFLTINSLYIHLDSGYEYFNRCGAGLSITLFNTKTLALTFPEMPTNFSINPQSVQAQPAPTGSVLLAKEVGVY